LGETLAVSVSYISPALDDFVEATIALLLGEERADFWWYAEPKKYQVLFHRQGEVVRLSVLERAQEVFSAEDSLLSLAVQVRSQLRQLRHTHGLLGYQTSWQRPFPREGQKRLEALIKKTKRPIPS
jgi:hypothetical protein